MATKKYQKGADGYYRTKAWDGTYNKDGTKHRVNLKSDKSSKDLERQVNELKEKVKNRQVVQKDDILFTDYANEWLTTYKGMRSVNTQAMYRNIIEKHFTAIDSVRLQDIEHVHLQMLINSAMDKPRTCQQIALTFKQILKTAEKSRKLLSGAVSAICDDVELPKYRKAIKRPLTAAEKTAILEADFTPREKGFVYLIYGCGLRREEALALTQADISVENRTLKVQRAVFLTKTIRESKSRSPRTDIGRFLCRDIW